MNFTTFVPSVTRSSTFNADCFGDKYADLDVLTVSEERHIVGVTESWFDTESRNYLAEYNLSDNSLFSSDRTEREILLCVKSSLNSAIIDERERENTTT